MKPYLIAFFLLARADCAPAQLQAYGALKKIWQAYHPQKQIMFESTIKIFEDGRALEPKEMITGRFILEPGRFYCTVGMLEMLQNEQYFLSVDNNSRIIVAGRKNAEYAQSQSPLFTPEKFMELLKSGRYRASIGVVDGIHELTLIPAGKTENPIIKISFDSSAGFMTRVHIERQSGMKMIDIRYSKPVFTNEKAALFSQQRYFSIRNNRIGLAPKYRQYKLINNL